MTQHNYQSHEAKPGLWPAKPSGRECEGQDTIQAVTYQGVLNISKVVLARKLGKQGHSSSPGFAHPATLSDRVLQTEKMTGSPGQTRPLI